MNGVQVSCMMGCEQGFRRGRYYHVKHVVSFILTVFSTRLNISFLEDITEIGILRILVSMTALGFLRCSSLPVSQLRA